MAEIVPRYKFRTFAQNFGLVETRMRELSPCLMIRESQEVYIVFTAIKRTIGMEPLPV